MDVRKEVMEAAANGIRDYLRSTRGAQACGPKAEVFVDLESGEIRVGLMKDGSTIYISALEI